MINNNIFNLIEKDLGIKLADIKKQQLVDYYLYLIKINKTLNLTRITEEEDFLIKNVYDSLLVTKVCDFSDKELVLFDLGTGAGIPGIILKIVFPNLKVFLVETLRKRCRFLEDVIKKLKLDNIFVVNGRAEDACNEFRGSADYVIARAFTSLSVTLEMGIAYLKKGGNVIAMRGSFYNDDLKSSENAIKVLKFKKGKDNKSELPFGNGIRYNALFQKQEDLKGFPRKYAYIKKEEL